MTALWIAPLLLLPLVGAPLAVRPAFRRFSVPASFVLAGVLGAALVSFAMVLFALAGARWTITVVAAAATVLAWAFSRLPAFAAAAPPRPEERGGLAVRLAPVLSLAAVGAAALATRLGAATSPDLLFFWGTKAQRFAEAGTIDVAWLQAPFHGFLHSYYPPLVTNLGAFASMTAGRLSWEGAAATFPLLLAALAIGLPGALGGARGRAAAASALAVSAVALAGIGARIAGNGDAPLVLFEILAMALLVRADADDPAVQWIAGLLLSGAAATKVEGLPYALAAAALFVLVRRGRAAGPAALRLLGPTAATLAAWFAFGLSRRLFREYSEYGPFGTIHLDQLSRVAAALASSLAGTARGLPWIVPALCLAVAGRMTRRAWIPIGTAAALAAFLVFAYLHFATDPSQWIGWSAARVLTPAAALLALAPLANGGEGRESAEGRPSPR